MEGGCSPPTEGSQKTKAGNSLEWMALKWECAPPKTGALRSFYVRVWVEGNYTRTGQLAWRRKALALAVSCCSHKLFLSCSSARAANALPAIYLHLAASAKFVIGRTEHQALPYVACLHIGGRSRGAFPTTLLVTTRHRLYELYMTQLPACLMRVKSTKDTTFIGQSFRTCATMASSRPRL